MVSRRLVTGIGSALTLRPLLLDLCSSATAFTITARFATGPFFQITVGALLRDLVNMGRAISI